VLVGDFEDGEGCAAAGGIQGDAIAFFCLHEGATERGDPTDVLALEIDFVGTYDADDTLCAFGVGVTDGGTEEDAGGGLAGSGGFGVDDDGGFNALHEEAEAGIDLTEAALAVLVVCIFAAIAIAGGPGDDGCDGRALAGEEEVVFVFETGESAGGDVVFEGGGGGV
jgi:hypothetical protein